MKIIRTICTLLFGVAVLLFFGLAYPHHLHYQEQYQLFFFDSNYVWEIVKLPGGLSDLLGRFCTQFFLFAWVGAAIIALLLSLVQLLTLRQACSRTSQTTGQGGGWLYGLSFVPSFLLWLFLLDENALLGGVWAVLLTLLASWSFDRLPSGWGVPHFSHSGHSHTLLDGGTCLRAVLPFAGPMVQGEATVGVSPHLALVFWGVRPFGCHAFYSGILYPGASRKTMVRHTLPSLPDSVSDPALGCCSFRLRPRTPCLCLPPFFANKKHKVALGSK